jgi:hypothetical protein
MKIVNGFKISLFYTPVALTLIHMLKKKTIDCQDKYTILDIKKQREIYFERALYSSAIYCYI